MVADILFSVKTQRQGGKDKARNNKRKTHKMQVKMQP